MSKQSKACDITAKVRKEIHERDRYCVVCGARYGLQIAHVFVNRSHSGLGVKENLALLCVKCHFEFDSGLKRHGEYIKHEVYAYMNKLYKIDIDTLKYRKGNR